ncbi:restriction endonuclease [Sphingomonas sp. FW199]|uniref:restriction endonuclease n=1 Tax=Sphingomonas sp. FW199 TaxID=3400217 RepID=UPI003CEDEADC
MSVWDYAQCAYELIERAYLVDACPFCRARLKKLDPETDDGRLGYFTKVWVGICQICGWWNARGEARERIDHYSTAVYELGSFGVLKKLDLTNVETPLQEVRDYLTAKYEDRLQMNPRLFELTVGSVFADHGYVAEVTAYSGDGGIDVILSAGEKRIGVQVKRWKNKVEATQIHSLMGAMIIAGFTKGMFVTTSSFRSGAVEDAGRFSALGMPIELLDAPRFFDALRISQTKVDRSKGEWITKIRPHLRKLGSFTDVDKGSFYED